MWPMLAMAGLGLAKGELIDKPKEKRQRMVASETARYSPWTHMQPGQVQEADTLGNVMQGGMAGAMYSQNANSAATQTKALDSMSNLNDAQAAALRGPVLPQPNNPWSMMGNYPNAPYQYPAGQGLMRPQ